MIIDLHAHAFPRLGTASNRHRAKTQLQFIQHHVQYHIQGFRRKSDSKQVNRALLNPSGDGIEHLPEVNFRIGEFGRVEFTVNGEDYYIPWYPCFMQDMEAPPELMLAYMDYVGVDKAVLQHDHVYGNLNEYLSDCVHRYPNRYIGLAQISEWKGHQPEERERLDRAVRYLGLSGLYFSVESFSMTNFSDHFDDPKFEPLWNLVSELKIPIFWSLYTAQRNRLAGYLEQVRRLSRWARAHPDIPCVYTHGIETIVLRSRSERFQIPAEVIECLKNSNLHLEIMLHLMAPDTEYPFKWTRAILKQLYYEIGPEQLLWGSDMPACERTCTYKQSMNYVRQYCDFLSEDDKSLFFGGNAARLFRSE